MCKTLTNKKHKNIDYSNLSYENSNFIFDELYNDFKKNPLSLKIIKGYIIIFIINFLTYYLINLIIKQKLELSITIIIFISILSLFFTVFFKIKGLKNTSKNSNAKFYFYDDFILLKRKKDIEYIFLNEISTISESEKYFNLYKNGNRYVLIKTKLEQKLIDYLRQLKQNIKEQKKDKYYSYKNFIKNYKNDLILYSKNEINEEVLNKYYKIKKVNKDLFINSLFVNLFSIHILLLIIYKFIFKSYNFNIKIYLFIIFEILLLTIIFQKHYKTRDMKTIIKDKFIDTYLYNNFILVNFKNKIIRYNYSDIKYICEKDNLLVIKFKEYNSQPIFFNKNTFKKDQFDFLNSKKIHTK